MDALNENNFSQSEVEKKFIFDFIAYLSTKIEAWYLSTENPQEVNFSLLKLTWENHAPSPQKWANAEKLYQGALDLCADIFQDVELRKLVYQGYVPLAYEKIFESLVASFDSRYQKNLEITVIQKDIQNIERFHQVDEMMMACIEKGYGQSIIQFANSRGCNIAEENDFGFPVFVPFKDPDTDELYSQLISSDLFQDAKYLTRYVRIFVFLYQGNYLIPKDFLNKFSIEGSLKNAISEYQQAIAGLINYGLCGGDFSDKTSPYYNRLLQAYVELNIFIAKYFDNNDVQYKIYQQDNTIDQFFQRYLEGYLPRFHQAKTEINDVDENKNILGVFCPSLQGEVTVRKQFLIDNARMSISYVREQEPVFGINNFENKQVIDLVSFFIDQFLCSQLGFILGSNVVVNGLPPFESSRASLETSGLDVSMANFKECHLRVTDLHKKIRFSIHTMSQLSKLAVSARDTTNYYIPKTPQIFLNITFDVVENEKNQTLELENYQCIWGVKKTDQLNITMAPGKLDQGVFVSQDYNFLLNYKNEIYKILALLNPEIESFRSIASLEDCSLSALLATGFNENSSSGKRSKRILIDCIADHLIKKFLPDYHAFVSSSIALLNEELKNAKKNVFICLQLFHFSNVISGILADCNAHNLIDSDKYPQILTQSNWLQKKLKTQLKKYWSELVDFKARLSTMSGDMPEEALSFFIKITYFKRYIQVPEFTLSDRDYLQLIQRLFRNTPILEYQLIAEQLTDSVKALLDMGSRLEVGSLICQLSQFVYGQMDLRRKNEEKTKAVSAALESCIERLLEKLKTDPTKIFLNLEQGIVNLFYDVLVTLRTLNSPKLKIFAKIVIESYSIWQKRLASYTRGQEKKLDDIQRIVHLLAKSYRFPNLHTLPNLSPLELIDWVNPHAPEQITYLYDVTAMMSMEVLNGFYGRKSEFEKLNLKILLAKTSNQGQIKQLALYYKVYFNYLETNVLQLDVPELHPQLEMIVRFIKMLPELASAFTYQDYEKIRSMLARVLSHPQISQCDINPLSLGLPSLMRYDVTAEQLLKLCESPALGGEKASLLTYRILSRVPVSAASYVAQQLNAVYDGNDSGKKVDLLQQSEQGSAYIKTALTLCSAQSNKTLPIEGNLQPGTKLTQKLLVDPKVKEKLSPATVIQMLHCHPVLAEDFAHQVQAGLTQNYSEKTVKEAPGIFNKIRLWWSSLFKTSWFSKATREPQKQMKLSLDQLKLFLIKNPIQAAPVLFFDEFTWSCLKTFIHDSDPNKDARSINLSVALFLKEIVIKAREESAIAYQGLVGKIRYNHHVREMLVHLEEQDLLEFFAKDVHLALSMFRALPQLVDKMSAGNEFKSAHNLLKGGQITDITPAVVQYMLTVLINPWQNVLYEASSSAQSLRLIFAKGEEDQQTQAIVRDLFGLQDKELHYYAWELLAKHPNLSQELLFKPSWFCQQCKDFVTEQKDAFIALLTQLNQNGFKKFSQKLQQEYLPLPSTNAGSGVSISTQNNDPNTFQITSSF